MFPDPVIGGARRGTPRSSAKAIDLPVHRRVELATSRTYGPTEPDGFPNPTGPADFVLSRMTRRRRHRGRESAARWIGRRRSSSCRSKALGRRPVRPRVSERVAADGPYEDEQMSRLVEDYAFLADLETAALVHRHGSIGWCCFPRFDSDACFAALLGGPEHGRWRLGPVAQGEATRRYRPGSLVLETEWDTADGQIRTIDFMPPRGEAPTIVRIVEGRTGCVVVESELVIRFGYGRVVPWMSHVEDALVATAGPDALVMRGPAAASGGHITTVSTFEVCAGERMPFALAWFPSHSELTSFVDADE